MQTGLLLRSEQLCFYIRLPLDASFSTATLSAGLGKRTISVCNFFKKRLQQVLASGRKEMNAAPHIPKGQNLQFNSHSVSIFFFSDGGLFCGYSLCVVFLMVVGQNQLTQVFLLCMY